MTQIGENVKNGILAFLCILLSSLQLQWHEVVRHMYSCKCLKMKGLDGVLKLNNSSVIAPGSDLLADSLLFGSFEK